MIIKGELHHNLFVQLRTMVEAMRELFNKTTQMFVERSAIHDQCSKQIGEYIARKGWIRPTDSIMVVTETKYHS